MNPLVFAFITYLSWGLGDVFNAITARTLGAERALLRVFIVSALLFLPLIPNHIHELSNATPLIMMAVIALGGLQLVGNIALNKSLRLINAPLALTIFSSYSALIVVLSVILFREPITIMQSFYISLIFMGIFLCTYVPIKEKQSNEYKRGVFLAIVGMACIGVFFTLVQPIIAIIGWFWPIYAFTVWIPILWWLHIKEKKESTRVSWKIALLPVLLTALLLRIGDFSFNVALDSGLTPIVAPIAGSYPTLSVLLSYVVFREKLTIRQTIGILLALVGIIALGFVGV
jgi:transporter family protein